VSAEGSNNLEDNSRAEEISGSESDSGDSDAKVDDTAIKGRPVSIDASIEQAMSETKISSIMSRTSDMRRTRCFPKRARHQLQAPIFSV